MNQESPGRIIKRIRLQDVGRSQEEFAKELGVSQTSLAGWEVNRTKPDATNLAKILLHAIPEHRQLLLEVLAEEKTN